MRTSHDDLMMCAPASSPVDQPQLGTLIKKNKMEARALLRQPATSPLLHFLSRDRSSTDRVMARMAEEFGNSVVHLIVCLLTVISYSYLLGQSASGYGWDI
jgi:hypothetical protein